MVKEYTLHDKHSLNMWNHLLHYSHHLGGYDTFLDANLNLLEYVSWSEW